LHLIKMRTKKEYYASDFIEKQLNYYRSLPEKQRRHFLAMEYARLGVGSQRYLAQVFGCSRKTILKGWRELAESNYETDYSRQRGEGGGRKKKKLS
jgi:biotin operon repressor